ncbi:MAG: hypothetical protein GEV28_25890 [Actinophytocola sp.]|uniref:anti-sigma factor family protein n=1 Tax=Actinophytocola sp. TaxID=1872138 RepID=UPI00132B411B|nr:hypothetical protein [Actinophytocola sp.]MPZ83636.1 hypothetical protein [Actinophytocola sp.]
MVEPNSSHDIADTLAEIATGAASGPDRARALSHLTGCEDCRRELAELTKVADEVLLVAPEHEPPAGFESAVLARIASEGHRSQTTTVPPAVVVPSRRRRVLRSLAMAAAAVVIAAGAAGAVWQATADDRELAAGYRETLDIANGREFTAAPLLDSAGVQVGHVFVYEGEPSWVFTVLGRAPEPGPYDVVVATDTWTRRVASCRAETANCGAGATIDANIDQINYIQLTSPSGVTLTATLTSWPSPQ